MSGSTRSDALVRPWSLLPSLLLLVLAAIPAVVAQELPDARLRGPGDAPRSPARSERTAPPALAPAPKTAPRADANDGRDGAPTFHGLHGGGGDRGAVAPHPPMHGPRRKVTITEEGDGGPLRVDTEDGPVWFRQTSGGTAGSDPFPRCLLCHGEIENITVNMMGMSIDCTACHGGDAFAETKEAAHVQPSGEVVYDQAVPPLDQDLEYQQFVNPSNLRVVDLTCGTCHPEITRNVKKSMMATAAGHYAGGLYQNGVVDTKTPIYGTFAITDDDGEVPHEEGAVDSLLDLILYEGGDPTKVSTHFAAVPSQACARCHLWSRGKGYRGAENADGVYRADGCAACHVLYANDGLSRSADTAIDHTEPGHAMHHVITKQIPTEQCVHCHHRGARIGLSFTGRAQMPPRLPSGPGVPGTTDERFNGNFHYTVDDTNPPDVHRELGLDCIDCHVQSEIMGDGNIYGHMDQATKIDCRTCHGTPFAAPTLTDDDGVPLPNVAAGDGGQVTLTSKVSKAEHVVPLALDVVSSNPDAACAMNGNHLKPEGGLECYSCHTAWVPNCFGCHFERNEQELGLNLMTGEYEVGKVRTNNKIFETLRPFAFGPNSDGRIAPYIVGCQPIADVTGPNGEKIIDFAMPVTSNGLSGLAINPVNPHTVRGAGEVRTCAECHRAPPSLGMGSGRYAIARDRLFTAGASGLTTYDRKADPGQPLPAGTLPFDGPALGIAVLPNVVEGTADFLYVARGLAGVDIFDRRPGAADEPIGYIGGVDAVDVCRIGTSVCVVDRGFGLRIFENEDPAVANLLGSLPLPGAIRAVPWGIHILVAAGKEGLVIVNAADESAPFVQGSVGDIEAVDVEPYAHYQNGASFAMRAYVADPSYGVRIVDLLPDYDTPSLRTGLPLTGARGLDGYTRYVSAAAGEPSREHDYLYVAAGAAGLHVYDITDPDEVRPVGAVTDLGGVVADVDVSSQLAPPGVDDYAILANEALGLQVVAVNDPRRPVVLGTVSRSAAASRVLVEVQQMDRFIDEHGHTLKENSHPFTGTFSREDIVRILSCSIDCEKPCPADVNGSGQVDVDDLIAIILDWGSSISPADLDGNGFVDVDDLVMAVNAWGSCP